MESFQSVLLIAIALSMDAFAVAMVTGCALRTPTFRHYVRMSSTFGFFQFGMPILGWLLGASARHFVEAWDHWIAFLLLAWVGGSMLYSGIASLRDPGATPRQANPTSCGSLFMLGLATSIDAFAVGLSFAFLGDSVWQPALVIGVVCMALTALGLYLGRTLARLSALNGWAELAGGIVLLAIGFNVLQEHHVFG